MHGTASRRSRACPGTDMRARRRLPAASCMLAPPLLCVWPVQLRRCLACSSATSAWAPRLTVTPSLARHRRLPLPPRLLSPCCGLPPSTLLSSERGRPRRLPALASRVLHVRVRARAGSQHARSDIYSWRVSSTRSSTTCSPSWVSTHILAHATEGLGQAAGSGSCSTLDLCCAVMLVGRACTAHVQVLGVAL
jgi:hypothetical protein